MKTRVHSRTQPLFLSLIMSQTLSVYVSSGSSMRSERPWPILPVATTIRRQKLPLWLFSLSLVYFTKSFNKILFVGSPQTLHLFLIFIMCYVDLELDWVFLEAIVSLKYAKHELTPSFALTWSRWWIPMSNRGSNRKLCKSLQCTLTLMTVIYSCISPAKNTIFAKCDGLTCLGFSPPTIGIFLELSL